MSYQGAASFDLPYNVYYRRLSDITSNDVHCFLNKFCGIFTFAGNKNRAFYFIKELSSMSRKLKLNFYNLIRYFIFHYVPFVYLRVLIIKRRRLTKPTLLTKDKAFFFAIK